MNTNTIKTYLRTSNFEELFNELGWNYPDSNREIEIDISVPNPKDSNRDTILAFGFNPVADRSGCKVFTCAVDTIPTLTMCRKVDRQLQKYTFDYIAIYHIPNTAHHAWVVPVKRIEKRDLVIVEYESENQADFLIQKLDHITFGYEEMTIADVREGIQAAFLVNSEKITKDFYKGFRKQHDLFSDFIQNLPDDKERKWYTSVMLNRLMFCYFIQKKGFLDQNVDYLKEKLCQIQTKRGSGKYYSFYRAFLRRLFSDGLNKPKHDREFEKEFGQIPYLNGGMFDTHQIERDNPELDIADEAFEKLFAFFDTYRWHLDTRITATGKDINPDVLGYIFEQYINDRAAMGAYYTKEDITEYIGKNCIIPWLLDALSRATDETCLDCETNGYVWQTMKNSGDKYIYDAVKKGYSADWKKRIPKEIANGLDTTKPNLLERRARWNDKTPEEFALPTEIWRETIARLQRCEDLLHKIESGEICHPNDLITYNLDMRQFAYDLIAKAESPAFVCDFFDALKKITVLDPTCGSGAFLFAALNILEPLYEICIERMQDFAVGKASTSLAKKYKHHLPRIKDELAAIESKYRSNIQYFIYKTIILNNLYGVDIMPEAVEIAKLRLFLKLVAVVDVDVNADNLGLDPLPDIDFNIRCGNTLVGYATKKELDEALRKQFTLDRVNAKIAFEKKINDGLNKVAKSYADFLLAQRDHSEDMKKLKASKEKLEADLHDLNEDLNDHYHNATQPNVDFEQWKNSHQPFHWLAEFYTIIKGNGGFDVIIGNPPYVEYKKKDSKTKLSVCDKYKLHGYKTIECGNLYAYVMERSNVILNEVGYISMIVPLSGHSTERMAPLVKEFYNTFGLHLHFNLSADANPQKLFEGVKFRLVVFIVSNNGQQGTYSTKYTRWYAEERSNLFTSIVNYNIIKDYKYENIIPKMASQMMLSIFSRILLERKLFKNYGSYQIRYNDAPINWMRAHSFIPYFVSDRDGEIVSRHLKPLSFDTENDSKAGNAVINSTLFLIWWQVHSSCYNLNLPEINNFGLTMDEQLRQSLVLLNEKLELDLKSNSRRRIYVYRTTGRVEYDEFYMKLSKPIIDEIDKVLAKHYGFTEEELDYIINYDIKYRMGDELGDGED